MLGLPQVRGRFGEVEEAQRIMASKVSSLREWIYAKEEPWMEVLLSSTMVTTHSSPAFCGAVWPQEMNDTMKLET